MITNQLALKTAKVNKTTILQLTACMLFVIAYYPVFVILINKWAKSEEYGHAFLTLPIIAYMVWSKRQLLKEANERFTLVGLLLVLFSTLIYFFSLLTQVHTLISWAMLLTIFGVLIYLKGFRSLALLFTPLLLLVLLVPVPDQIFIQLTFPLQLFVSQISEIVVRLFGIPVFREGNVMNIPGQSFEVVEACSGLRSMITMLTLSIIVGYFTLKKVVAKGVLVLASVPVAILVNIVRVVTLILVFHYLEIDLSEGSPHTVLGLLVFGLALALLLLLQKLLNLWELKKIKN